MMDVSSAARDVQHMATDTMEPRDFAPESLAAHEESVGLPVPREDEDEYAPTIIRGRE